MTCSRCSRPVPVPAEPHGPWTGEVHGSIAPLQPPLPASHYSIRSAAIAADVPLWMPWPLPAGWQLSGLRLAGDDQGGACAAVVGLVGPDPLPTLDLHNDWDLNTADLLLVAEKPGVGLGAHLARIDGIDPGEALVDASRNKPADIVIRATGHDVPMWSLPTAGHCAVYVGEAAGDWLWALAWPEHAAVILMESFSLMDLRDPSLVFDIPFGAPSVRLGQPQPSFD